MPGLRGWADVYDEAVYTSAGLRLVHSFKADDCRACRNDQKKRQGCKSCMGMGKTVDRRAYQPVLAIDGLGVRPQELRLLRNNVFHCVKRCSIRASARTRETWSFGPYPGAALPSEPRRPREVDG